MRNVHARRRQTQRSFRRMLSQSFWQIRHDDPRGYAYALVGVVAASLAIAMVERVVHIANISLLYLPVVLWLAAWVGRRPAILASVLAFLAYDFFFIAPLFHLTVADPTQWLSLLALLATSLVTGQLASAVRRRAQDAQQSRQRITTLYELAQVIATTTDQHVLFDELTRRLQTVFEPYGVRGVAILLPGEGITPIVQAMSVARAATNTSYQDVLRLSSPAHAAAASWAFEHGTTIGDTLGRADAGSSSTTGSEQPHAAELVFYVPLNSRNRSVGLVAIAGFVEIRSLVPSTLAATTKASPQRELFAACCDQIALAIDRAALQQQAIHAEALTESDQLKDVFLGSVTHDLRTPLASIKAAVTSLLGHEAAWSATQRRELLESIDQSADRLNRLVENLLDISRQEAGVATPNKDWYLISDVIASVLDRMELAGRLNDRDIRVEIAEDIPLVPMDHTQIEQVLTNLLENAVKYSPADRPIRITAALTDRPPRTLEVRVIDQGIGVPPSELQAIFDKFYRVQHVHLPWATDRPPTGTGLGLAISDNIVRAHGGKIWAESAPGEGTTVIITLPVPPETPSGGLPDIVTAEDQTPRAAGEHTHAER